MAVREILKMGDPRLSRVAQPVRAFDSPALRALIADLLETMQPVQGARLAAPQIGVELQLVVFGFESSARYPDAPPVPRTILLNPVIGSDHEPGWCWVSRTCDVHGIRVNADSEAAYRPPEPTRTALDGPAQRRARCLRFASGQ